MREIKFRGRSKREWAYGMPVFYKESALIEDRNPNTSVMRSIWVNPESIGQYTGMKDRNGKEIYEGDIVRYRDPDFDEFAIGEVIYYSVTCSFVVAKDILEITALLSMCEYEVIGNIHDNPDLLKS
ncbi:MAG: YopX family protein [Muribaculaceae bacterium]|nr:YopX family protein [Muribaculaceae bacterium]